MLGLLVRLCASVLGYVVGSGCVVKCVRVMC